MINPVNSDKNIQTTTDRSSQSPANTKTDLATGNGESVQETQASTSSRSTVDVDNARQLYEMETARSASAESISTPQQARSLVQNLLQQISNSPESAAEAQLAQITRPLANLLESAPA
ncbi:MAG: hypothetical protein ABW157_03620 [Candidatus Thiodiazotropha sp. LLP2]